VRPDALYWGLGWTLAALILAAHVLGATSFVRDLWATHFYAFFPRPVLWIACAGLVAGAVASAARLGVSLATIHGLGGRAMLEAAVGALPAMGTRLLAITMLTSHDDATLDEIGVGGGMTASVRRLALLAKEAGMDGVVASAHEVALIREACGRDLLVVTPGIRPAGAMAGDQARAATPAAALAAGADYLVVGRPIIEADDPAAAADRIVREMEQAGR